MTTMLAEMYEALKEAGASDATARKAAEAVAGIDSQHREIRGEFNTVKWMIATNITMTLLISGKLFLLPGVGH